LRGFAFAPDGKSFYYAHEAVAAKRPFYRAAYQHVLGTLPNEDWEVFFAGEGDKTRLIVSAGSDRLVFSVYQFLEKTRTDIYLKPFDGTEKPERIFHDIDYSLNLRLLENRIFAVTDLDAPNRRIVEIRLRQDGQHEFVDVIPESDVPIGNWLIVGSRIFVSYMKRMEHTVCIFDLTGRRFGELPIQSDETVRMLCGSSENDELLLEAESFTEPIGIFLYSAKTNTKTFWTRRSTPFDPTGYSHSRVSFASKDGTRIPMYLVGRQDVLDRTGNPTVMTSYGGYGVSMSPQFSVFVAFLMERGCLFALPNIRGGSEFGIEWHNGAKRHNRQRAYDDFLCAADWLIGTGLTAPQRLAIFGGSNSGLLVGAALTQRPELFRAVVCMVPMLDRLRYHLFDSAYVWKEEFGTAEDAGDFTVLAGYSPYHQVRENTAYPATMIVSGDADRNCNPMHARKMTARLQAANISDHPIFLDYSKFRGHSPVLPLSQRIDALTDRMAFLCDQLQLPI
jgi:prolyl oligopeptidase